MVNLEYIGSKTLPGTGIRSLIMDGETLYYTDATYGLVRYHLVTGWYESNDYDLSGYGIALYRDEVYVAGSDGKLRIYDTHTLVYRGYIQLGIDIVAKQMSVSGHIAWIACGTHLLAVNLVTREIERNVNYLNSTIDVAVYGDQLVIAWPGRGLVGIDDITTLEELSTIDLTEEVRSLIVDGDVIVGVYLGGLFVVSSAGESYDTITELNDLAMTSANVIRKGNGIYVIAYTNTQRIDIIKSYDQAETLSGEDSIVGQGDIIVGQDDLDVGTQTYVATTRTPLPRYACGTITRS